MESTSFDVDQILNTLSTQGTELVMTWGVRVLGVVAIFVVGRWLGGVFARASERALVAKNVDKILIDFVSGGARWAVYTFAALAALDMFGIETMSFVAVLGAAGLAVGLALQGTLAHFASGVMLVLFRPFSVGHVVDAGGVTGKIEKLGLFSTVLLTPDNRLVTVPNGAIWGAVITNFSSRDSRRVDVTVGVAYNANVDDTKAVLVHALRAIPGVHAEPAPDAYLSELGASSVDFSLRAWVDTADYWSVREKMVRAAKLALDDAKIGIPYPQMDVHFFPQNGLSLSVNDGRKDNAARTQQAAEA